MNSDSLPGLLERISRKHIHFYWCTSWWESLSRGTVSEHNLTFSHRAGNLYSTCGGRVSVAECVWAAQQSDLRLPQKACVPGAEYWAVVADRVSAESSQHSVQHKPAAGCHFLSAHCDTPGWCHFMSLWALLCTPYGSSSDTEKD